MKKMSELLFKEGAGKLMGHLAKECGTDLVYSLAYQEGQLFLVVTAHPNFTNRKFATTEDNRILLEINENDLSLSQEEVTATLVNIINESVIEDEN
jgi:hypothetical protein